MDRSNHYEAAFEGYLQRHRLCYVAVDETRRAVLGDVPLKSLDFVVYGESGARLLVDVKGRRFPVGPEDRPRHVWESWSTADDVRGLQNWTRVFGDGYQGLLVFIYHVLPLVEMGDDTEDLWFFRGKRYLLRAVSVDQYQAHMHVRSPKWKTVGLPRSAFGKVVRPFSHFTQPGAAVLADCPF
jgi:hypothetical protein